MFVMEIMPAADVRSGHSVQSAGLIVDPADILLQELAGESMMIRVRVQNNGRRRSKPTVMRLESAPLGAFVPWRPLTELPVPSLKPDEWRELAAEVPRRRASALGSFDHVAPNNILAAANGSAAQLSTQHAPGIAGMLKRFRGRTGARDENPSTTETNYLLAPDLWELSGRGQPHWAGNIHVFVGERDVERHLARALRIYPGRPNLAMFLVGEPGKSDAYSFEIAGLTPEWRAALYDVTKAKTLVVRSSDAPIREMEWVEADGSMMVVLAVRPPDDCDEENVEIHVTQRSQQKTAVVEFNLDATAQGTGCYPA